MREEDNTFKKDDSVSSVLCPSYPCSSPHICSSAVVAPLPINPSSSFEPPSFYPSLPSVANPICPSSPSSSSFPNPSVLSHSFTFSNSHILPYPDFHTFLAPDCRSYSFSEYPPYSTPSCPTLISPEDSPLSVNLFCPYSSSKCSSSNGHSFPSSHCQSEHPVPILDLNMPSDISLDYLPPYHNSPNHTQHYTTSPHTSPNNGPAGISADIFTRNTSPDNCSSHSLAPSTSFIPTRDLIHLHTSSNHVEFSSLLSSNSLTCCSHAPLPMAPHLSSVHLAKQMDSNGCKMCHASVENWTRMDEYKHRCEQFLDDLSRFEDWLKGIQMTVSLPDVSQALHREAKFALNRHEVVLKDLREKLLDLESLNIKYWKLAQVPHQIFLPNNLCSRMQEVNQFLDKVQKEAEEVIQALKMTVQQREEFDAEREEMRLWLTEMDLGLSSVEYMYNGNSTEKIHRLQEFQEDVRSTMKRMDGLLERGDQLIAESYQLDADVIENELKELGSYCQDIFIRFSRFQKRLVSTKLVFEDNLMVDDLETMSLGSSEVFCEIEREDIETQNPSLILPGPSLLACMQEVPVGAPIVDLEWDPLGDVGTSESIDGGESFHTANSVPWRVLHRESRSSLNSVLWSLGPEANHGGDTEHYGDVMNTTTPSWDSHSLKRDVKETDSQREYTDPSAKPNLSSVPFNSLQETFENGDVANTSSSDLEDVGNSTHGLEAEKEGKIAQNYSRSLAADLMGFNSTRRNNCILQRRRQVQMERTQNLMLHTKSVREEVSILMENSDEIYYVCEGKSSHCTAASLPVWIKRLVYLFLLILFLGTCLLVFTVNQPRCYSHHFAWSLMLSYVNGPPPT